MTASEVPLADSGEQGWLSTAFWWGVTLLTLVVVDDLTSGPIFWLLSQWSRSGAAFGAFAIYWGGQVWVVRSATTTNPSRVASFLLGRLGLERRSRKVAANEESLHRCVTGPIAAVALSPIMGGVLPTMLLWRYGAETQRVRRLAVVTGLIYAAEFAFIHAWLPGSIL